jgi:hypothetical protein
MSRSFSRREVLRSITLCGMGSAMGIIPIEAAEQAHRAVAAEKAKSAKSAYAPKYFGSHQYKTLQTLCETIIPADADGGGAIEAGAPEFIDLLTSENADYQMRLGGGLLWLDSTCRDRYDKVFLECDSGQQKEMLDAIAYRRNSETDATLSQGVEFFSFLRNFTADGFFTSAIGIKYLGYIGNTYVVNFKGCPPVEGV